MCLLAAHIPLFSQSQARIDSLQCQTALHNMLLLWDLDTFCLLLSGSGDPLPSTSTPPSPFSLLLLPYYPLFSLAWDRGRVMTEVSAQVTVILSYRSVPTGPRSRCIPPRSRSPSICSLCSRDPHSFPSRASTVQPGRGLVTLDCSRREVCVNVSLSLIPHLFF